MLDWRARILLSACAGAACWNSAIPADQRFVLRGHLDQPAEWVSLDAQRVAFGSGSVVVIADARPFGAVRSRLELAQPIDAAVLAGASIYAVAGGILVAIDLDAPEAEPVAVDPQRFGRGRVHLARAGGLLAVAGDGAELRLYRISAGHAHGQGSHAPEPRLESRLRLQAPVTGLDAAARSFYATLGDGSVIEIDARVPRHPVVSRRAESTLWAFQGRGLRAIDLGLHATAGDVPFGAGARAVAVAGRRLFVAAGNAGLLLFEDRLAAPLTYHVDILDASFSPSVLTVRVGDTVRWRNDSEPDDDPCEPYCLQGSLPRLIGFHSVRSCDPTVDGCSATAAEPFSSGEPAPDPWSYGYTFTRPGRNPYVCMVHGLLGMTGEVVVEADAAGVPEVSDGTVGAPLLVDKLDPAGSTLVVSWDSSTCGTAADHFIVFGSHSDLPATYDGIYGLRGSRCAIGPSPFTWTGSPAPLREDVKLVWFFVLGTDAVTTEGPWGRNTGNVERSGPAAEGASGQCGMIAKDLSLPCP